MADERLEFPIEDIPDCDCVFMRAYRDRVKNGVVRPSAFEPHKGGLSVDWDRYSTADATLSRANNPTNYAVVRMGVGLIRDSTSHKVGSRPTGSALLQQAGHRLLCGRFSFDVVMKFLYH